MATSFQINNFIRYYFRAQTKFQIHSPFVFDLIENVLEDKREFYAFSAIERLRKNLLLSDEILKVTDLGAGSITSSDKEVLANSSSSNSVKIEPKRNNRLVKEIAKNALLPPSYGKFLFRLIHYLKPENLIELGTSLGISTLYQSQTSEKTNMISLEGCPETAAFAEKNFKKFPKANIDLIVGHFRKTLPEAIQRAGRLDYVYFDGHHEYGATLAYFENCLKTAHENSIFVFDDIYWSKGMAKAWEEIKENPKVTLTLDLFRLGIVLFRSEQVIKQHFTIIESWKKPWARGFFAFETS